MSHRLYGEVYPESVVRFLKSQPTLFTYLAQKFVRPVSRLDSPVVVQDLAPSG
jgi:hypothetical protein